MTKKVDKFINAFKSSLEEEGMVANAPGTQGGFGGDSPAKGPTAGFDPVMGTTKRRAPEMLKLDGRKKGVKKYITRLLKDREKREKKKQQKKLKDFNPHFSVWDNGVSRK
tara:strand:- start:1475 stop:1804 length:330 start_codon:yes stop_codon:yes gene_type:complete